MVALILGMLVCVALALVVVALVAIPARREGRDLLTPRGEEVVAQARERTQDAFDRTGEVLSATRDRVSESITGPTAGDAGQAPDGGPDMAPRKAS